jgi:hypothetical protein
VILKEEAIVAVLQHIPRSARLKGKRSNKKSKYILGIAI